MTKSLLSVVCLLFLSTAALADVDPAADVHARFDQIERAMNGDEAAIDALAAEGEDDPMLQFIVGTSLANLGRVDEAATALQRSIRLGDDMGGLVLAEIFFDERQYLDAFAWAQFWVQSNFTIEEIRQGAANSDLGVSLLRDLLDRLDDEEIRRAEQHAGYLLNEWLGDFEKKTSSCIQPQEVCEEWTATRRRAPAFPMSMGDRRRVGFTRHVYVVDENGRVADQVVLHASHPHFARSAERSLRRWRFESSAAQPSPALLQTSVIFKIQ